MEVAWLWTNLYLVEYSTYLHYHILLYSWLSQLHNMTKIYHFFQDITHSYILLYANYILVVNETSALHLRRPSRHHSKMVFFYCEFIVYILYLCLITVLHNGFYLTSLNASSHVFIVVKWYFVYAHIYYKKCMFCRLKNVWTLNDWKCVWFELLQKCQFSMVAGLKWNWKWLERVSVCVRVCFVIEYSVWNAIDWKLYNLWMIEMWKILIWRMCDIWMIKKCVCFKSLKCLKCQ